MSYPYPQQRPPSTGDLMRQQNAERAARKQDFRIQQGEMKGNPNLENPLNRAPAWDGQLTPGQIRPAGVENYSSPSTPTPAVDTDGSSTPPPGPGRVSPFPFQRSPQERAIIADTNPNNPNSWMGKSGIANPPPINNAMGGTGREGVVLPDSGSNYRGEKSYVAPYSSGPGAGNVIEVNPSKDLLYSRNGQTSGQLTAQAIQDKYQTPGTVAHVTQGNVTDAQGNTMAQNGKVTPPPAPTGGFNSAEEFAQARNSLQQSHPDVFKAGTPQNLDFADYAQQHGEPAAHAYMQTAYPPTTSAAPTPSPAPDSAASAAQSPPPTNRVTAFPNSKQPPGA